MNHQAVAFEVPLDRAATPPRSKIVKRLKSVEGKTSPPATLEVLQKKQAKARALRQLEQSKKIGQAAQERLSRALERRTKTRTEQEEKIRTNLDTRMEKAIEKKCQLINVVIEKAKKETEKLGKATQTREELA